MKYQLHGSKINNIVFCDEKIIFSFSEGFWAADESGKEIQQMQDCKLVFEIDRNDIPLEEFISVRVSKRGRAYKTVPLTRFVAMLQKSPFAVDMEYDCSFANRKMLQIYSNRLHVRAEIFIEEIKDTVYGCENLK